MFLLRFSLTALYDKLAFIIPEFNTYIVPISEIDKQELSNNTFIPQNVAVPIMPEQDCIFTLHVKK